MADIGAGNNKTIRVNRVRRIRHQHVIARTQSGQRQMRQTFLRADGGNHLGFRIEINIEFALVPARHGAAQTRNTLRLAVTMGTTTAGGFHQLINNVFWRVLIRVTHRHIDDVLPRRSCRHLHFADHIEDIRRQALNAREVSIHNGVLILR